MYIYKYQMQSRYTKQINKLSRTLAESSWYSVALNATPELCNRSMMLANSNDNENVPDRMGTTTTPVEPVRVAFGEEAFWDVSGVEREANEV